VWLSSAVPEKKHEPATSMKTTHSSSLKNTTLAVFTVALCLSSLSACAHPPSSNSWQRSDVPPFGLVIPRLPGYVRSPFTQPPRLLDVRGMAPGSKAWCPYSHRLFIVPDTSQKQKVASYSAVKLVRKPPLPLAQVIHSSVAERPYGIAVPGRPGFVFSPHASGQPFVDVTGLSAGTAVRCPYTGKVFRVPLP